MSNLSKINQIALTVLYKKCDLDLWLNPSITLYELLEKLNLKHTTSFEAVLHISSEKIRLSAFSKLSDYPLVPWSVIEINDSGETS